MVFRCFQQGFPIDLGAWPSSRHFSHTRSWLHQFSPRCLQFQLQIGGVFRLTLQVLHLPNTLWWTNKKLWKIAIEIVDFPMKNGGSFHGKMLVHQRVIRGSCWKSRGYSIRMCHVPPFVFGSSTFLFNKKPLQQRVLSTNLEHLQEIWSKHSCPNRYHHLRLMLPFRHTKNNIKDPLW